MIDDDDEEDDDGVQKVELTEGFITLDQVHSFFSHSSSPILMFGRRGELRCKAHGAARLRSFMLIYAHCIPPCYHLYSITHGLHELCVVLHVLQ